MAGNTRRKTREKSSMANPPRTILPAPPKRGARAWPLLALLAAGSFGVAYALVAWSRGSGAAPTDAPPGMVWVPPGEFTMGSDAPDASPHERPAHRVRVDGFWMDQTDVTNAQFRRFVEA